jgi:hypothetical protein
MLAGWFEARPLPYHAADILGATALAAHDVMMVVSGPDHLSPGLSARKVNPAAAPAASWVSK